MYSLAIIIPCYNEKKRLKIDVFMQFAKYNSGVKLVFIDDGSIDGTSDLISRISQVENNVHLITYQKNKGKGNAVREGMIYSLNETIPYIAYTDADLSTPLEEILRLFELGKTEGADIVFGSRIKKIDNTITRSSFRHFAGRVVATLIDSRFNFNCYDTQCGAKVIKASHLKNLIQQAFYTKWFFDVELLCRIRNSQFSLKIIEEPLKFWTKVKGSKINIFSIGIILKELYTLHIKY